MSKNIFAVRLAAARTALGWSQWKLAHVAEMQPSSISHFERGGREPSMRNLIKVAGALRVSADYLLGLVDEMHGHMNTLTGLTPTQSMIVQQVNHEFLRANERAAK